MATEDKITSCVSEIVTLLVAGKFDQVESRTSGIRLKAQDLRNAIEEYGRTLVIPPKDGFELIDIVEVANSKPRKWSVTMPLWTEEEGRSDLSIEMTIVDDQSELAVELDDIHVL